VGLDDESKKYNWRLSHNNSFLRPDITLTKEETKLKKKGLGRLFLAPHAERQQNPAIKHNIRRSGTGSYEIIIHAFRSKASDVRSAPSTYFARQKRAIAARMMPRAAYPYRL
jgi:hypothetical protein